MILHFGCTIDPIAPNVVDCVVTEKYHKHLKNPPQTSSKQWRVSWWYNTYTGLLVSQIIYRCWIETVYCFTNALTFDTFWIFVHPFLLIQINIAPGVFSESYPHVRQQAPLLQPTSLWSTSFACSSWLQPSPWQTDAHNIRGQTNVSSLWTIKICKCRFGRFSLRCAFYCEMCGFWCDLFFYVDNVCWCSGPNQPIVTASKCSVGKWAWIKYSTST